MAGRRTLLLCVHDVRGNPNIIPRRPHALRKPTPQPRLWIAGKQDVRFFTSSRPKWREALDQEQRRDQPVIDRTRSKIFHDADEAVADFKSGSTLLSAGFGLCGTAGKFPSRAYIAA